MDEAIKLLREEAGFKATDAETAVTLLAELAAKGDILRDMGLVGSLGVVNTDRIYPLLGF